MVASRVVGLNTLRAVSSIGALALAGIVACGARSSIVDEQYGFGAGGSAAAAGSSGGAPGNSGAGGFDPNFASKRCGQYCQRYSSVCSDRLDPGQDCSAACERDLNGASSLCQALGIAALDCLAPFYARGDCFQSVIDALSSCGERVDAFAQCAGVSAAAFLPIVDPAKCNHVYSGSPGLYCSEGFNCGGREVDVSCGVQSSYGPPICSCNRMDGTLQFPLSTGNRCLHAAAICTQ